MTHNDDLLLNQLAREAQQYLARSYERRRTLTQLIAGILQSGRVSRRPYKGPFSYPQSIYEDLYNEALNTTFLEICQNIDRYDPNQGDVMGWCNSLLKYRFLDALKRYEKGGGGYSSNYNLDDLESYLRNTQYISDAEQIRRLIVDENPRKMFTQDYIKGNPRANFQFLAIARIWDDRKWQDISTELKIPSSSLCEFYKKKLKEFTPYFREQLQE